jgi:D-beta-D-heptose 7-phosphate kinase/D-beta-D-heptose 1-phosphate adenosyltransferase
MADSHIHHRSRQRVIRAANIRRVPKVWGEERWIVNRAYCGKQLLLKKNHRCSLHAHGEKDEVFFLLSGRVLLEVGRERLTLEEGDVVHIRPGEYHRFTGLKDSVIVEFSTHHREADSFRRTASGHIEPERYERQSSLLRAFARQRILVVGDVMLDRYVFGSAERLSQEAPIPVIRVASTRDVLGGAANSAANIAALGAHVHLCGVIGDDSAGHRIAKLAASSGLNTSLITDNTRPTTEKERVVAGQSQVVRVDREDRSILSSPIEKKLLAAIRRGAKRATAILVSDYAKGLLTPRVLRTLIRIAHTKHIPLVLDPKPHSSYGLRDLRGVTVITPNLAEVRALVGYPHGGVRTVGTLATRAMKGHVLITRGADGLDLYVRNGLLFHADSLAPEVVDVSGAGDTVSGVVALCLAAGASMHDAADVANRAAAVVVTKQGTATLTLDELSSSL